MIVKEEVVMLFVFILLVFLFGLLIVVVKVCELLVMVIVGRVIIWFLYCVSEFV